MQLRTPFSTAPGRLAPVLVLTLLLPACSPQTSAANHDSDSAASGVKERELPPVHATPVVQREMVDLLETTSKLESEREVELYPRLPGIAVEVLVEEGDYVEEGDVLARLENRNEALAVRDAEVGLQEANDRTGLCELSAEEALGNIGSIAKAARQAERDYERDRELADNKQLASPMGPS